MVNTYRKSGVTLAAALLMGLAACLASGQPEPGVTPGGPAPSPQEQSPIQGARQALDALEAKGRDVKELAATLEELSQQWDEIQEKQRELQALARAFGPRMQELSRRIQSMAAGGEGKEGETPLDGVGRTLDRLEKAGHDVTALRAQLDELRPAYEKVQARQKEVTAQGGGDAEVRASIEKEAQEVQARLQELVGRIQELVPSGQAPSGEPPSGQ